MDNDFFMREAQLLPIFNEKFMRYLLEHYKKVKLSQNMKGEIFAFIPNRELTAAIVIELAESQYLKEVYTLNLKSEGIEHESSFLLRESNSIMRREEEFKDQVLSDIFKYVLQYNLEEN